MIEKDFCGRKITNLYKNMLDKESAICENALTVERMTESNLENTKMLTVNAKIANLPALSSQNYVANITTAAKKATDAATLWAEFETVSKGFRYTRETFDKYAGKMIASK